MDHIAVVVADQSFDDLAVVEGGADPQAVRRRKMIVEAQIVVPLPFEGLDEEDGFDAVERDLLHLVGAERPEDRRRCVEVEIFGRRPLASLRVALDGAVSELDDQHVQLRRHRFGVVGCFTPTWDSGRTA